MHAPRTRLRPFAALVAAAALLLGVLVGIAPAAHAVTTGSITGTIYSSADEPIQDGYAVLYTYEADYDEWFPLDGESTDEEGRYTFSGVQPGDYRVMLNAQGFVSQAWQDGLTVEDGTTFTIAAGQARTGISATLQIGASISGRVTVPGGAAEEDVDVYAYRVNSGVPEQIGYSGYSDEDGDYTVDSLPPGEYTLRFNPMGDYPVQYLGGTVIVGSATTFDLDEGEHRTGVDQVLSLTPSGQVTITGTVTGPGGAPIEDATVAAMSEIDDDYWETQTADPTDEDGNYTLAGLLPGDYKVAFSAPGYATEYWNASASLSGATVLTLDESETRTEIDASMVTGSTVSGKVSKTGGATESGIWVEAILVEGGGNYSLADMERTSSNGNYMVDDLAAGTYTLAFFGGASDIPFQFLGGGDDIEAAQTFLVGAGVDLTNVNATVVLPASLSGTVLTPSGGPAGAVDVTLLRRTTGVTPTWGEIDQASTKTSGAYSFGSLSAGTYSLSFSSSGAFPTQFFGGVSTLASAVPFTVGPAQDKTGVDYSLRTLDTLDTTASTTTLSLSTGSRSYGTTSTATIQVAGATPPAGTVLLKDGATVVGSGTLASGTATVAVPATLAVGTHTLVASYTGSGKLLGSTSATKTLTVVKATSTVSAKLAKKSVKKASKGKVTVTVTAPGGVVSGSVAVKDGAKVLKTVSLKSGKATITLPKLKKGKHKISVAYKGSGTVNVGSAKAGTLKVT